MKGRLLNCILVFQTPEDLDEGQQIVFEEKIDFSTATILHHQDDKTIAAATLVDYGVFGEQGFTFHLAPTLEELQESQNEERTFDKLISRTITDEEFKLIHDYLSVESNGKKGTEIGVSKSNIVVFDISENIKKVIVTEMYLCDKNTPNSNTETIITQFSINEGVVIFEEDFSSVQDSGDIDISEINDII